MKMKKMKIILSFALLGAIMISCNNNSDGPAVTASYPYNVRLTDAPNPVFKEVNVDIQGIEVTSGSGQTVTLNVTKGIYNLLELFNGTNKLIATDKLQISEVDQIRLILGPNNTVVDANGVSHPLGTPSAQESGLKLQVHQTLQQGILYEVILDFDANKSIVDLGNGDFKLKPVIRTIEKAISGNINGTISPVGLANVVAHNTTTSTDYSTSVDPITGKFSDMGLPPGTYDVIITPAPASLYLPVTKTGITVTAGNTTDLGTITLTK